ncbi:MAG TPA: nucleotide exchange factor GrpE [Verrucomicrobiae bacterium]|jgi:molecular chaperone GrpE (heat shock protein)
MTNEKSRLPWWPFLAADVLLLGVAGFIWSQGHRPLLWWEAFLLIACAGSAAWCFLFPFLRRSEDEQSLAQARLLSNALEQIQKIDQLAAQVSGAASQWKEFQAHANQADGSAKSLAGTIAAESKAFAELLQKASDAEKTHLRTETEKLRRAEMDWLQVVIHILDHAAALQQAARHSGQPALVEQVGQFQSNCREAARRVGLTAVAGREGEPFDPNQHQVARKTAPDGNAVVGETLVPGYTFQGQLVRRPLVAIKEPAGAPVEA